MPQPSFLLTTLNAKYIHMNLAIRLLYELNKADERLTWKEFTIKENPDEIAAHCSSFEVVCFSCYIWNITQTLTEPFDKVCLALYPYDNLGSCTIGATAVSQSICLNIDDANCWGFEPIRFTWMNQLGGRDWFTFIKRNTFVQQASRTTLYKLPGYWSAATYSVKDNQPARFGTTVFRADLANAWTASTDWLTEEQSAWLREMFASPSVIAYLPDRTEPVGVIIQDAEYAVQTIRRENLFQYFVSFVESLPANTQGY